MISLSAAISLSAGLFSASNKFRTFCNNLGLKLCSTGVLQSLAVSKYPSSEVVAAGESNCINEITDWDRVLKLGAGTGEEDLEEQAEVLEEVLVVDMIV